MRPRVGVQCGTPSRVSQGVAIVVIYPCGKARNSPPEGALKEGTQTYEMAVAPVGKNPLSLALDDSRSVLAVKGPLSPLRALDCCGLIWRDALFTREKREFGPCGRAERFPFGPYQRLDLPPARRPSGVWFSGFIPSRDGFLIRLVIHRSSRSYHLFFNYLLLLLVWGCGCIPSAAMRHIEPVVLETV